VGRSVVYAPSELSPYIPAKHNGHASQ